MIPLSGRMPGRASGPSWSRDDDGSGLQYVSWKSVRLLRVFPSKGIYRRKGDVRRWTRWSHHLVARPGGGPHHPMVRLSLGPSPSLLWTPSSCQVNRKFGFHFVQFRLYFLCNFSETQNTAENRNWHGGISLIGQFWKMHKITTKCKQNTKHLV
jgi:hypothetical protein